MSPINVPAPVEAVIGSPLFIKAALVVGGVALAIGGFRFLYRKATGG